MNKLFSRWGIGLSFATGAAAVVLVLVLATPGAQAKAAAIMTKGVQAMAKLATIHLRGQMRTAPADNLSMLVPDGPLQGIELWKQFGPDAKWRVEKSGRVEVMDGEKTIMLIKPRNLAFKWGPEEARSDASWLLRISNLSETIASELKNAQAKGWKMSVADQNGADGRPKSVVTIHARSGLPDNDYLKNQSIDLSDTRWVYCFDSQTELLESVQAYLNAGSGEKLILEISQIEYNQPIDPAVFQLQLPANVAWYETEMKPVANNEKYAAMTAQQAARAFFEACGRGDWAEAQIFWRAPFDEQVKQMLGGLEVVSIGEPFTSAAAKQGVAPFVPYEIKFKNGEVKKFNLHVAKDKATGRWSVVGGL